MKYIKQFLVILGITFLGEILKLCLPLPIPASIYGMVIMFFGLMTGIIKLDMVTDTGRFLIEIMPVMFIPAAVGLIDSWGILKPICVPVIVITFITTIVVMVASGRVTQWVIRWEKGKVDTISEKRKKK